MNLITVTLEQILLVVPALAVLYCVVCNRASIWKHKKTVFHVILIIMSVVSIAGIAVNRNKIRAEERQAQFAVVRETRMAQNRLARENHSFSGELIECEDPKQLNLPGKWWNLYQSLKGSEFWEAKLTGIESFTYHYDITDVEPLPLAGFDAILDELYCKKNNSQTARHVHRAKAALEPYLSPFNAHPTCFVKPEKKEQKTEEKTQKDGEKS